MKSALITGVTGQDGLYMAQLLSEKGYRVCGTSRNVDSACEKLHARGLNRVELIQWDLEDERIIHDALRTLRPSELYNFAAYTSGAGMFEEPLKIGIINGLAVTRLLDGIRRLSPETRFCQASSREIYGIPEHFPQDETTKANPRSPYGAAKLYADSMVKIYRGHYGLFASSAILFNHESPHRGINFVTKKIVSRAVEIKLGKTHELGLGNLDACRDWGYAGDYVAGMWLMLQQGSPDDFVFATGQSHSVREFCQIAFEHVGLDWMRYITEDQSAYRIEETVPLIGDARRAREILGWKPSISFRELVCMMVDAEVQAMK